MAEVFLATQRMAAGVKRRVVIKAILPHLLEDSQFVEMFMREAKIAAILQHPNIAQIFDVTVFDERPWIVMEFLRGRDLWTVLRRLTTDGMTVPPDAAAAIVAQAATGLDYAHRKADDRGRALALVHRDISPHNLFLTRDGHVRVLDFGVAKSSFQPHRTQSGVLKGKLAYMAPEQARGEDVDARADQFALGVILWEALTGTRLFSRDDPFQTMNALFYGEIPPPSKHVASVPAELDEIALRALSRDPSGRYPSCEALAGALRDLLRRNDARSESVLVASLLERAVPSTEDGEMYASDLTDSSQGIALPSDEPPPPLRSGPAPRADTPRPDVALPTREDSARERIERAKTIAVDGSVPPSGSIPVDVDMRDEWDLSNERTIQRDSAPDWDSDNAKTVQMDGVREEIEARLAALDAAEPVERRIAESPSHEGRANRTPAAVELERGDTTDVRMWRGGSPLRWIRERPVTAASVFAVIAIGAGVTMAWGGGGAPAADPVERVSGARPASSEPSPRAAAAAPSAVAAPRPSAAPVTITFADVPAGIRVEVDGRAVDGSSVDVVASMTPRRIRALADGVELWRYDAVLTEPTTIRVPAFVAAAAVRAPAEAAPPVPDEASENVATTSNEPRALPSTRSGPPAARRPTPRAAPRPAPSPGASAPAAAAPPSQAPRLGNEIIVDYP